MDAQTRRDVGLCEPRASRATCFFRDWGLGDSTSVKALDRSARVLSFLKTFFYLWRCWVSAAARRLSLIAARGPRSTGSAGAAHALGFSAARGNSPDWGLNSRPLH